jgi:hypothetical protein
MRLVRGAAVISVAAMCAWMLAGCVPPPANVIPTSVPTAAPVFASEDEALAAAVKAYEGYLAVSDVIGRDGGREANRLSEWVTDAWLPKELEAYKSLLATGNHFEGKTVYSSFGLERYGTSTAGVVEVVAYVCLDVSKSTTIDARGKNVTPPSIRTSVPMEVFFKSNGSSTNRLLLDRSVPWSGQDFCGS